MLVLLAGVVWYFMQPNDIQSHVHASQPASIATRQRSSSYSTQSDGPYTVQTDSGYLRELFKRIIRIVQRATLL